MKPISGGFLFNEILPADFPFQNQPLNQRAVFDIMGLVYDRYDWDQTVIIADALKDLAFASATQSGLSLGIGDFMKFDGVAVAQAAGTEKVDEINRYRASGHITEDERYRLVIKTWSEVDKQVHDLVADQFGHDPTSLKVIVDSEARGKINNNQIKHMMAMIGIQSDTTGKPLELPINSSYFGGLNGLEYFVAARGGRKSLVDVALSTADSGYLTRRLVYVAQDLFTIDSEPDQDYGLQPDPGRLGEDRGFICPASSRALQRRGGFLGQAEDPRSLSVNHQRIGGADRSFGLKLGLDFECLDRYQPRRNFNQELRARIQLTVGWSKPITQSG